MTQDTKALAAVVSFEGIVCGGPEPLRSPVSGLPCAHWRLRVVEHITPRMQLVHEVASPEAFELAWATGSRDGQRAPVRIRLDPESARIHAAPVLHREGTPGALAAARHLGLGGPVYVEEVMIRDGETVTAEGILDDPAIAEGPFRGAGRDLELLDATVRLATRSIGPALLPWALGTAAALLGTTAAVTYAAWRYHVLHLPAGAAAHVVPLPASSCMMRPPEFPHPRMP
jgi:hypothetical protein